MGLGGGDAGDANNVVCNCGEDAVLRTVRKEGKNTGQVTGIHGT